MIEIAETQLFPELQGTTAKSVWPFELIKLDLHRGIAFGYTASRFDAQLLHTRGFDVSGNRPAERRKTRQKGKARRDTRLC